MKLLPALTLTTLLLTPLATLHAADVPAKQPNIILILADDLGYADLGCQGSEELVTPRIDTIAADGIRFTDGYMTAPQCVPSRAGLLIGRYQNRFDLETNSHDPTCGLPLGEKTMGDQLRAAGYATAMMGKWHLGFENKAMRPNQRGFDETLWHPVGGVYLPIDTTAAGDTFNGAGADIAGGMKIKEAVLFANDAATISVTRLDAQASAPGLEELKGFAEKSKTTSKEIVSS